MLDAASLGQMGSVLVTGTDDEPSPGTYMGFLCITDAEIGAFKGQLTDSGGSPLASLTGHTFSAGMYVPVPFYSLTMVSGTILCIKAGGIQ